MPNYGSSRCEEKRQGTAALQNAGAHSDTLRTSAKSWSAAVPCRFRIAYHCRQSIVVCSGCTKLRQFPTAQVGKTPLGGPQLARIFHTHRRVRARGLQGRGRSLVGRVPSRGALLPFPSEYEICGLALFHRRSTHLEQSVLRKPEKMFGVILISGPRRVKADPVGSAMY